MARLHTIYTYKKGDTYYYSIRSCNNHTNSLGTNKYKSRQGRNEAVRKLVGDPNSPKYLVVQEIPPKK